MAGVCVGRMSHKTSKCSSSDGVQIFQNEDGSLTGFCFACNTFIPDPLSGDDTSKEVRKTKANTMSPEELQAKLDFIQTLPTLSLPERKLKDSTLAQYGIRIGLSEEDGKTPTYAYFPYTNSGGLLGYKVKHLPTGRMFWIKHPGDPDLFGWEQAKATGARRLIITEGEFDAPAMRGILATYTTDQYKDSIPAVVSIPNGAGNAVRDLRRVLPEIRKYFKDISLAFDQDAPGQSAVEEVCKFLPEAKVINLPAKDANDCLIEGKAKAAFSAATFNVDKPKNTRLIWGSEIHDAAKTPAEWGLSWPWQGMTELTRGIRFGETIYIGAGEKMGKSEVVNAIGEHLITQHGLKVFMAKPEEANTKTYKLLASKVAGKIFHDPKVAFDEQAFDKAGERIQDKICMLNLYQNINWEVLKSDIYQAVSQGVKAVFIDPITNLTNGMSSTQINEHLQGVAQELAAMAKDLDIVIFIFCHLNKPPKGSTPWDRGGVITTDYFAGSSAMARSCNYAIGLQGNKDPELTPDQRNYRDLVILADREYGESGSVRLYWNRKNGLFTEVTKEQKDAA